MALLRSLTKSVPAFFAFAIACFGLAGEAFAGPSTFQRLTYPYDKACSYKSSIPGWTLRYYNVCSTATVGGAITYIEHHDKAIKCTWSEFQGEWAADPGVPGDLTKPIVVTQQVGDPNPGALNNNHYKYATCSGWSISGAGGIATVPSPFTPDDHANAPYGSGLFWFKVEYKSTAVIGCEDANSGIGNNCGTFTDAQNKKHNSGITLTGAAKRTCETTATGTKLTYTFACGDGVAVDGYLTLVPTIDGAAQPNPDGDSGSFTNCTPERIAAGACTMQYGGIPQRLITKGKNSYYVVDTEACKAAFPGGVQINNALDSGQTQELAEGQILLYTEVATGTECDAETRLPTFLETRYDDDGNPVVPPDSYAQGTPTAAYGRYCQSDVGKFSDNAEGNIYGNEGTVNVDVEGFDNELRICPVGETTDGKLVYHTGQQDVEKVGGTIQISVINQPNTNISCGGNQDNDSGVFKVWIPDQTASNSSFNHESIKIDPLSAAPKLYVVSSGEAVGSGISPYEATPNVLLADGRFALELKFSRCSALSPGIDEVVTSGDLAQGTSPVDFVVKGETSTGAGLDLAVEFTGPFSIDVNW